MLKRLIYITLVITLGLTAIIAIWQRHFIYRAATYPHDAPVTSTSWYQPLAAIKGAPEHHFPVSERSSAVFAESLLDSLSAYAGQRNSTALIVSWQDSLVLQWYDSISSPTATTNSMSLVKSVIALLIGVAIEEDWINSVEDPVSDYLSELQNDNRAKITIRHLLEMNSGLERYDSQSDPFSDLVQLYLGQDAHATALRVPAVADPGKVFEYNNANTQLLGILLERSSGEHFTNLLSTYIWKPIGASDAAIWLDVPGGNARMFCCFFATAEDWLRVGQLFLNNGSLNGQQIVPAQWIERMIMPSVVEPDYGLHIWLGYKPDGRQSTFRSEPYAAPDVYYLAGQDYQKVYIIPSAELVIVRVGELPNDWDDAWIPNRLIRAINKTGAAR